MSYDKMVSGTTPGVATREPESTEGQSAEFTSRRPSKIRGERMDKPTFVVHGYTTFVDDWRRSETRMMTNLEQRGLLWELIWYASQEGSLPDDEAMLRKIADCTPEEWARSWPAISSKFQRRGNRLHHPRVDAEIAKMGNFRAAKVQAGKSGAAKRWQSHSTPIGSASGTPDKAAIASFPYTSPTHPIPSPVPLDSAESETETRYLAFRDAYPIDRRKDTALARQYYVQATGGLEAKHDRLMAALRTYVSRTEARFVQNMERWLESPPWHLADQAPEGELRVVARDMDHWRQLKAEGKVSV